MAGDIRKNRLGSEIRKFISTLLISEYGDSPIAMISVHKVSVMKDLRTADIFYSTFSNENISEIQKFLDANTKSIRHRLAGHLKTMKFIPQIRFIYDDSVEKMVRLEKIFDSIKQEE